MDVKKIYKKLLAHFGPQGWWPIFDKKTKKCIYHNLCDRTSYGWNKNAFEICVGAILTQNTAWKNVEKAFANLCSVCKRPERSRACRGGVEGPQTALTPTFILSCKNLEKLIQPAGYYNQKAKKLRIFSEWWLSHDVIPAKPALDYDRGAGIQAFRKELLSLWGVGPETADSMLLYAFNKPIFVIDAYTKRLCKECGVEFKNYDDYRQFFESQLPKSARFDPSKSRRAKLFNEYHALIVAWGKLYSKDKPAALKIIK